MLGAVAWQEGDQRPWAAPSGERHFVDKNFILKRVYISNSCLLLFNKVLNGLSLFSFCVWKPQTGRLV